MKQILSSIGIIAIILFSVIGSVNASYNVSGYIKTSSGTAIENAYVTNNVTSDSDYTNSSGYYNLSLPNGTYLIKAEKLGYASNTTTVTVSGTDVSNANITLENADTSFTVTLPAGYTYAHFNLTGIAGGIAHDTSGNGNDGTIYGAKWVDGALSFDGVDDYVDCGNDESLNITDAITIEVWVKPAQNSTHVTVAAKEHFTNKKGWILIQLGGTDWYFRIYNGTTYKEVSVSNSVDLNTWQHIVATYDKQYMRLYKNGVQIGKRLCDWSIATTSEPLCVGYRSTVGQYFNGTIDEVRIYNRALNETEIQNNYNGSITRNGLVGEWTFDYGPSSQQNVTPEGQNSTTPFYNITNTGNVNLTVKMKINATIPNVILKADTDNNPSGAKEINTTYATLCEDLPAGNSINIWLWTDLSHAEEQETEKELEINVSQTT